VLGTAALIGTAVLFASGIFSMMRSSEVYTTAMQRATSNPTIVEALGTPIEPGWYLTGEMTTSAESGTANLVVPIHGPKGEADLHINAEKVDGQWRYAALLVDIEGRDEPIDLLVAADTTGEAAVP
jgi:hypothetical protein